jgi:hypothetical protein
MARLGLGREEPEWYDSPAEQDAAVHWCGCGQSWSEGSGRVAAAAASTAASRNAS